MRETEKNNNDRPGGIDDASLIKKITPLAQKINCLDIGRVARVCVKIIPEMLGVRFASLYILDEDTGILHLQKYNHPFLLNKIVSLNQRPPSPMVMAVRSGQIILASNIDTHSQPVIRKSQRAFYQNYKTKNCAIVPLICHNKVVGVLNLADKIEDNGFNADDILLIQLLSQLISASIGNIKKFEKIRYQARTDGQTGLVNHRTFYDYLEKELLRARRYGGNISLIMIDVDNLKVINDKYGHRAGDKVINKVGDVIRRCIRQIDIAARYGGDEFAVILPNTNVSDAQLVAQRMVNMVANSPIEWKKEQISPSISVGLGEYSSDFNPEDMTSCSDRALYIAKKSGKNTVRIYDKC